MFCKECGNRFIAALAEDVCPICNTQKGKGDNFCPFCGEPMTKGQVICYDCGLHIHGEISQMGDGTIDTGLSFYHVKGRNLLVCAMLSIITCGTYMYYWMLCLSEEYAAISGEKNEGAMRDLLLTTVTCGLYGIYWAYRQAQRYEKAMKKAGRENKDVRKLFCISQAAGPLVGMLVLQHHMNKF